jgi:hypothetical protein
MRKITIIFSIFIFIIVNINCATMGNKPNVNKTNEKLRYLEKNESERSKCGLWGAAIGFFLCGVAPAVYGYLQSDSEEERLISGSIFAIGGVGGIFSGFALGEAIYDWIENNNSVEGANTSD